jgi:hypothetical protein
MSNSNKHIAIIDDGINQNLYKTGELKHNIEITPELKICERVGYDPFLPSHGTTCAAIIKKYSPDAVLSSIKILGDESRKGMKAQLVKALEWCADSGIQLVNMSLGTVDYRDFIEVEKTVKYAADNGVIIVAACNNQNIFTCPASLENVIGVKRDDMGILKQREYVYNLFSHDGVEITACGKHHLIKYNGESKITTVCNSFSAPAVTSVVWDIIKNNDGIRLNELKKELICRSAASSNIKVNECFQNSNIFSDKCIDIPVVEVYNYYGKKMDCFMFKLADMFRADGYNAVSVVDETRENVCNGRISLKNFIDEKKPLQEILRILIDIYAPHIIVLPARLKDNCARCKEKTDNNFEADLIIIIHEDLSIEIKTDETAEIEIFDLNKTKIEDIYSYIVGLFGTSEGRE